MDKAVKFESKKLQALILIFCFLCVSCTSSNLVVNPEPTSTDTPLKPNNIIQKPETTPVPVINPAVPVNTSASPPSVSRVIPVPNRSIATPLPVSTVIPLNPVVGLTAVPFTVIPVNASASSPSGSTISSIKPKTVLFDTGKNPFGNASSSTISSLESLRSFLLISKFTTVFDNFATRQSLDDIGTIIIPCPSIDYSQAELDKLLAFVRSGKKVIILGEWGGFAGFSAASLNDFLKEANLKINEDVIRESENLNFSVNEEQLIITNFLSHPVTENLKRIALYSSASVNTIEGGITALDSTKTKIVAYSSTSSYRIQDFTRGTSGVIAVSAIGSGKIVVIGDSSIFSGSDSNSNGKQNLDEVDNKQLILNIINW